ncbi:MAG: ABC transporter permease [Anaerolineae bacterium]|nr:ABC transporter permease [Anaerolineae bacterium]
MSKTWLIAQHHFLEEARKRTFLLVLLALPLFIAFAAGLGYLFSLLQEDHTTLGYVGPAGWVTDPQASPSNPDVTLVRFDTTADAQQALEEGEVDAYYVLSASADARQAQLIYYEAPPYSAARTMTDLVRRNRMAGQPAALVERAIAGAHVTVHTGESDRAYPGGDPTLSHFLPLIAAGMFTFLVITTFGYLGEAVVIEKESRTMEVLVTSVSAGQMMAGKVLGGLGIALLQIVVWVACLVLIVVLGGSLLEIEWLQNLDPSWRDIAMVFAVGLPVYLFLAALTTALAATLVESQEIQQMGGLAFLLLFFPLYLLVPLIQAPNGPLALGLSFFPFTSVASIAGRSLVIEVPTWQIAVAAAIALACGIVTVWLAGRAFRLSMLRYGQRLRWRELLPGRRAEPS